MCVNIAEELFCKTRITSRSISTLLGVVIMQRSSSTGQGVPVGVYLACCMYKYCSGALLHDRERQQEYIYPVIYKTRSTSSISILLCLLILQRSSSTRQRALVGVYLPCSCVNKTEELFYKTRSTSRSTSTLLGVLILQRSSSTRQSHQ